VISTVARESLEAGSTIAALSPMVPLYFDLDPESIAGIKEIVERKPEVVTESN
jgi:hypothetical protein